MKGIYKIINAVDGKFYIGSAADIDDRWSVHKSLLRNGKHANRHLQSSWKKYGEESFQFEVIEIVDRDLIDRENFWIAMTNCTNPEVGYNIQLVAGSSRLGMPHTEETKKKISEAQKGEKCWLYGKKLPDEHVNKVAESNRGKKRTAEQKQRISESQKGEKGFWYGKSMPAETKAKMSEARKGRRTSTKISREQAFEIKVLLMEGNLTHKQIAETYGITRSAVGAIKNGKSWSDITLEGEKLSNESN
jgi:group I intron endonuclease